MAEELIEDQTRVLVDGAHGVDIPKVFIMVYSKYWDNINPDDADMILKSDPDHEGYWEAWDAVLADATFTDNDGVVWRLWQEEDLFAWCGTGDQWT